MQTQLDIFGNEVATEEAYAPKPRETIKGRFRKMYGYDNEHRCGDCKYCVYHERERRYYKCILIGTSSCESTDIRLKDPACKRFEADL